MTDYHVHIGQWRDGKYFYADDVFTELKRRGIDECWFSSTTSCVFAEPIELYKSVRDEMKNALVVAKEIGIVAHSLYWVVPDVIKNGVSIEQAMSEIPYEGFKIHPRAQEWKIGDEELEIENSDIAIAKKIFDYAEKFNLRILIHTGNDEKIDSPKRFEAFIKNHPNCIAQLGHIKNVTAQEYMLRNYDNVVVDSAFSEQKNIDELVRRKINPKRILWGSDFPINSFY